MKNDYNLQFDKLCDSCGLGSLSDIPEQIYGGHLHRMYAVSTTTGKYAIKALNPHVMQRPQAKQNIIHAERIAQIAAERIPALPAKIICGTSMPEVDGQFYLVFDWVSGVSYYNKQISVSHCRDMGRILAQLHQTDFSSVHRADDGYSGETPVDWAQYLQLGQKSDAEWSGLLAENLDNLYSWNTELIRAAKKLSPVTVIGHGDLEPKNVLWQQDQPVLIDWEAAGLINPMHDLVETALYWAGENGVAVADKFTGFVKGYKDVAGSYSADWPVVLDKGLGSKLGWLKYSIKRSLGIECSDEAEQKMGTDHVFGTMKMLHEYQEVKNQVIEWMDDLND